MLGRRTFLIPCGWIVAAPALAKEGSFLATSNLPRLPLADPLALQTDDAQLECPVLQIEGWDTPFVSEESGGNQMWISINQSWRTTWR
jgi:hypothetical protein